MSAIAVGKAKQLLQSTQADHAAIVILLFGSLFTMAQDVAKQLDASLVNMRFVKPLDNTMLKQIAEKHRLIVTLEDNALMGGAGSAVNEYLQQIGNTTPVLNIGLPDHYLHHAEREQQQIDCGLSVDSIINKIHNYSAKYSPAMSF
jgi:1-deoxy-D-xylulose-5-phosphate synthase